MIIYITPVDVNPEGYWIIIGFWLGIQRRVEAEAAVYPVDVSPRSGESFWYRLLVMAFGCPSQICWNPWKIYMGPAQGA